MEKSPLTEFKKWFQKAQKKDFETADNMILATVNRNKFPSARTVLLKGFDSDGFRFFTNYTSQKSKEITANPYGALVFNWKKIHVNVRIEGKISKLTRAESEAYFASRPRLSQLSAWASPQSKVISNRKYLLDKVNFFAKKFKGIDVPCPPYWGGFSLKPKTIDFLFLKENRLHERFTYRKKGDHWTIEMIAP